jgi:tetratricopeptide (TPR) repeat protein
MHSQGIVNLALITWHLGDYSAAKVHAYKAQRLARISADLCREAEALYMQSRYCSTSGNYKQSISLYNRARYLLGLCGMSGGNLDHSIMTAQADIHKLKSEYIEAHTIHSGILQETSEEQDPYIHSLALLNIAEIEMSIGAPKNELQSHCATARKISNIMGYNLGAIMCDTIEANLHLREGNILAAKTLFEKCIKLSSRHSEIRTYCLERLGNTSCWGASIWMSTWTTVFLVHSLRQKEKLGTYKALQFLGDVCLAQGNEHTAISLFTVALQGFTQMDVHCSRAECMLRLGDISKGNRNLLKAVELWGTARPLFERSSQAKQVEHVDERLAGVEKNILEQYRTNLAHLAELNPSAKAVEDRGLSEINDIGGLDLDDEEELEV